MDTDLTFYVLTSLLLLWGFANSVHSPEDEMQSVLTNFWLAVTAVFAAFAMFPIV